MTTYATARKLALLIIYLKETLRERRKSISDHRLAELMNEAQADQTVKYELSGELINRILNARVDLEVNEESSFMAALQLLIDRKGLNIQALGSLPRWLELQYSSHNSFRELLRQPIVSPVEGDLFGEVANILAGVWHLFYVSPIDRKGRFKEEIRSLALFAETPNPNSKVANVLVISKHGCWKGHAFVNDSHLYMMCTDVKRPETAFFITNRPTKSQLIAGAGTALERVDRGSIRPVAGIFVFGEKSTKDGRARLVEQIKKANAGDIEAIITRTIESGEITDKDLETVQRIFCERYDIEKLKVYHRSLYGYLQKMKVNNRRVVATDDKVSVSPWLYVAYP